MGVVNWHNLCRINLELSNKTHWGLLGGTSGKEPACQCRRHKGRAFDPWVGKIPWRRAWQSTPVFLPGECPWTEEPSRLQSIGSQRLRYDWSDLAQHIHPAEVLQVCFVRTNQWIFWFVLWLLHWLAFISLSFTLEFWIIISKVGPGFTYLKNLHSWEFNF